MEYFSSKKIFSLKVDEGGFDSNLKSLAGYGDRPSLCFMSAIDFTFDLATVTVLSILKWRG
jgi:hypothetical protein